MAGDEHSTALERWVYRHRLGIQAAAAAGALVALAVAGWFFSGGSSGLAVISLIGVPGFVALLCVARWQKPPADPPRPGRRRRR